MNTQTIIFLGPQGVGKGTQVRDLVAYLSAHDEAHRKIVRLETGKPLRALAEQNTYTAEIVRSLLEQGKMVPFFLTTAMVMHELMEHMSANAHLIMDGYPRDMQQAQRFEEILTFYERQHLAVVLLDAPDEVVKQRMLARGRGDDTEAAISERLAHYHAMTEPLIEFYHARANTTFIRVDGAQSIQDVQADIRAGLSM